MLLEDKEANTVFQFKFHSRRWAVIGSFSEPSDVHPSGKNHSIWAAVSRYLDVIRDFVLWRCRRGFRRWRSRNSATHLTAGSVENPAPPQSGSAGSASGFCSAGSVFVSGLGSWWPGDPVTRSPAQQAAVVIAELFSVNHSLFCCKFGLSAEVLNVPPCFRSHNSFRGRVQEQQSCAADAGVVVLLVVNIKKFKV